MTNIKVGDYVKVEFEGEVAYPLGEGWVHIRSADRVLQAAQLDHCTVIDPPVRVGDEISYDQAISLPDDSVVVTSTETACVVVACELWSGGLELTRTQAERVTLRVVYISNKKKRADG